MLGGPKLVKFSQPEPGALVAGTPPTHRYVGPMVHTSQGEFQNFSIAANQSITPCYLVCLA
jgi:hypothetical protein